MVAERAWSTGGQPEGGEPPSVSGGFERVYVDEQFCKNRRDEDYYYTRGEQVIPRD